MIKPPFQLRIVSELENPLARKLWGHTLPGGLQKQHRLTQPERESQTCFIHIPKTAGLSISNALYRQEVGHRKWAYLQILHPQITPKLYTFTFVRNPWTRFQSAFNFLSAGGISPRDQEDARSLELTPQTDINQFIGRIQNNDFLKKLLRQKHFQPQHWFIQGSTIKPQIDFIGRFENLLSDFQQVAQRIPGHEQLTHQNTSKPGSSLNSQSINILGQVYREDCQRFHYNAPLS